MSLLLLLRGRPAGGPQALEGSATLAAGAGLASAAALGLLGQATLASSAGVASAAALGLLGQATLASGAGLEASGELVGGFPVLFYRRRPAWFVHLRR